MPENSKKMTTLRPTVIALAYDDLCTFEFGVAVEIFGLPRPEMGENWYRFAVAGIDEGELRATGGVRILADGDLSLLESADRVIIPGWRGPDAPVPERLCEALRKAHARESQRLGQLFDYLHQQLAKPHSVDSLSRRVGMSQRTFLRRFQDATGTTPARWLLNERLLRAKDYLENSRMSIDLIAEQTGFGQTATLRHHFRQRFALSPAQYRKRFAAFSL